MLREQGWQASRWFEPLTFSSRDFSKRAKTKQCNF